MESKDKTLNDVRPELLAITWKHGVCLSHRRAITYLTMLSCLFGLAKNRTRMGAGNSTAGD